MKKQMLLLACVALFSLALAADWGQLQQSSSFASFLSSFNKNTLDAFFQPFFGTFSTPLTCATPGNYSDVFTYPSVLAGVLIIAGVALMYMAGQILMSPPLIAMAKDEIGVTGRTLAITAFIILWVSTGNQWMNLTASNSGDPLYQSIAGSGSMMIDAAMEYSKYVAYQTAGTLSALLIYNTFLQTIYVGVTLKAMFSFNVGPILKPLVDMFAVVIQFLSASLGEWVLHFMILCFIKKWTWTLFIPVGMLMRAFPQTRDAGNALFGIFFALAAIYPLMIVANYEIYKVTSFAISDSQSALGAFFGQTGVLGSGIYGLALLFTLGSVIMPFIMGAMINLAFELVNNAIYYIVIISLLLPFINIFITLTSAREITRFFGSEINFGSFVKLI
jgi:hypothetical protein